MVGKKVGISHFIIIKHVLPRRSSGEVLSIVIILPKVSVLQCTLEILYIHKIDIWNFTKIWFIVVNCIVCLMRKSVSMDIIRCNSTCLFFKAKWLDSCWYFPPRVFFKFPVSKRKNPFSVPKIANNLHANFN